MICRIYEKAHQYRRSPRRCPNISLAAVQILRCKTKIAAPLLQIKFFATLQRCSSKQLTPDLNNLRQTRPLNFTATTALDLNSRPETSQLQPRPQFTVMDGTPQNHVLWRFLPGRRLDAYPPGWTSRRHISLLSRILINKVRVSVWAHGYPP